MATLFIANPTKQNNHLYYRVPEISRMQEEIVPAGGQIQIAQHLHPTEAQLQGILEQLESTGCVAANEINKAKDKRFVLVYKWGSPIDVDKIAIALDKNDFIAQQISDEQMLETASLALDNVAKVTGIEPADAEMKVIETTQNKKGVKHSRDVRTVKL